ncbi:MAG: hypothetical protein C4530_13625 [Desulfobacteraceae bacterium]|nr:MAG: hypothetical protein C4530_13625 [Desulfobacteraceae bacterium]
MIHTTNEKRGVFLHIHERRRYLKKGNNVLEYCGYGNVPILNTRDLPPRPAVSEAWRPGI